MLLTRTGIAPVPPKVPFASGGTKAVDVTSLPIIETTRSFELADIGQLQQLELEDFSIDFSGIDVPKGELSDAQKDELASVFAAMVTDQDTRAGERDRGE
jgi:type IV secretion system protein VirD4